MHHGSLQNQTFGRNSNVVPTPGMGATELLWTDRHAYTIVSVSPSGKSCIVQRDKATRADEHGMSDSQYYNYERDPNGPTCEITLSKDGCWYTKGGKKNGRRFAVGVRREYYDYSF